MAAHPDPNPPTEIDALMRDAEFQALRRLVKLTESENERVALRACEVVLRCVRERRREEVSQFEASGGRRPPEGASLKPNEAPLSVGDSPSGGLRPPLAEVKAVPHKLLHSPKPKPAFRAVPLDKLAALADLSAPRRD